MMEGRCYIHVLAFIMHGGDGVVDGVREGNEASHLLPLLVGAGAAIDCRKVDALRRLGLGFDFLVLHRARDLWVHASHVCENQRNYESAQLRRLFAASACSVCLYTYKSLLLSATKVRKGGAVEGVLLRVAILRGEINGLQRGCKHGRL